MAANPGLWCSWRPARRKSQKFAEGRLYPAGV